MSFGFENGSVGSCVIILVMIRVKVFSVLMNKLIEMIRKRVIGKVFVFSMMDGIINMVCLRKILMMIRFRIVMNGYFIFLIFCEVKMMNGVRK